MKKSNKIVLALASVAVLLYLVLYVNYKPEYRGTSLRDIIDQYNVVVIEDETLTADEVVFTVADSTKDTYIYYEKENCRIIPYPRIDADTLRLLRPTNTVVLKPETPLHLHLKGVDEVMLRDKVIYKR